MRGKGEDNNLGDRGSDVFSVYVHAIQGTFSAGTAALKFGDSYLRQEKLNNVVRMENHQSIKR